MNTKSTTLIALTLGLLGTGCSHVAAKPQPLATTLDAPKPSTPSHEIRAESREDTSQAYAPKSVGREAIYFDFDSALVKSDAGPTLQEVATEMKQGHKSVRIEGNCDERGTTEYNMALGDKRAREAELYLERLGIPERRISIVSYGSERPLATGHDESAWAKNRRDDFKFR